MNIAIKGHPTRGRGVIQLLEILGGRRTEVINANDEDFYYYIDKFADNGIYCTALNGDYAPFTLEEFEEKFPYKVGDVVVNHKYGKGDITQMRWIDDEIVYEIYFEDYMAYCKANELCKYDAFKGLLLQELTEYLSHATREELDKTMEEIEITLAPFKVGDKVIVKGWGKMGEDEVIRVFKTYFGDIKYKTKNHLDTHYFMEDSLTRVEKSNKEENMEKRLEPVYELGTGKILYYEEKGSGEKYIPIGETTLYIQEGYEFRDETNNVINAKKITLARKQSQYPKTYRECCEVLAYEGGATVIGYDAVLLNSFQKLKLCRDAYWKIAGDFEEKRKEKAIHYVIYSTLLGEVGKDTMPNCIANYLLDFPTREMRDAFYVNFKDLIEQCKELL